MHPPPDPHAHLLEAARLREHKAECARLELRLKNQKRTFRWLPVVLLLMIAVPVILLSVIWYFTGKFDSRLHFVFSSVLFYLPLPIFAIHSRLITLSRLIELEAPDYHSRLKARGLI